MASVANANAAAIFAAWMMLRFIGSSSVGIVPPLSRIRRQRREPRIVHRRADREVVQALPRLVVQAGEVVHLVVEVAADAGRAQSRGLGFEVEHLSQHAALAE